MAKRNLNDHGANDYANDYDYDLIVIGGGSGGVRAARIAAGHGGRVVLIEQDGRLGGTCVLRGCVPKKLLVYGSDFARHFADAEGFGWRVGEITHDWGKLIQAKNAELDRLAGAYRGLLADAQVAVVHGVASLADGHSVEVTNGDGGKSKLYKAKRILIATGSTPSIPDIPGLKRLAITSREALDLPARPNRIVVFGSGYIAVEFAGIFAGFGCETHLVFRADLPLRGFDKDMREGLMTAMAGRGVVIHNNTTISEVAEATSQQKQVQLDNGEVLVVDAVLAATGRTPNSSKLNLPAVGVKIADDGSGAVVVDEESRTSVDSIFAIGDVTNRLNLTPVALAEGHAFADRFYGGGGKRQVDYKNVPSAVFSQPPLATVGLTEEAAKREGREVEVYATRFTPMRGTISKRFSGRGEQVLMKLVVDAVSDKVLGGCMLGDDAPEIIQGIAIAITSGASKAAFDATIGIHP
ncbi:MAG: glutathione-disulfide reductase, partial [Proteobacteria bacterium]|nr:glutathione-disulfide reductase [Pseudomonadota bacterium]